MMNEKPGKPVKWPRGVNTEDMTPEMRRRLEAAQYPPQETPAEKPARPAEETPKAKGNK